MRYLRHIVIVVANIFLLVHSTYSQNSLATTYTDISKIKLQKSIFRFVSTGFADKNASPETIIPGTVFIDSVKYKGVIPRGLIPKQLLLKFNICNSSDSGSTVYFFPGFYYQTIQLYRLLPSGSIKAIPAILPSLDDSIGYRAITLPAKDSATIVAALSFVKTYNNSIRPKLVSEAFLPFFIEENKSTHSLTDLITYILCGLLLMMILFSLSNYFQGANPEFLYYSGYAFFLGAMLFLMGRYNYRTTSFSYFLESYLDFIMQMAGIVFYCIFMQRFLNTKEKHPFLFKLYNFCLVLSYITMLSFTIFHYFDSNYNAEFLIENAIKVILLLMVIIFLVYSVRHWDDKLLRYLFWGNLCLFVFSLISQLPAFMQNALSGLPGIFRSSVFYYEIGLFLELVFFLAGLNHKNRRRLISQTRERESLKAQNLLQEYEKEIAVYKAQQAERERISADMHDELGSGMTAIRLMSEIARNKMKENTPIEIEKISHSANDVLNKMNAIIWSMNSGNDTLDNMISYIRSYALEYFDGTPIECKVNTPENIPDQELTGDKRRNIFLCIKETLNNALKHSKASLITINIEINDHLKITITDNGTGIDLQNLRQFGNGLKNIGRRMESIGGSLKIENNNGTVTTIELHL
jgi:signal transduction histidine kinase